MPKIKEASLKCQTMQRLKEKKNYTNIEKVISSFCPYGKTETNFSIIRIIEW